MDAGRAFAYGNEESGFEFFIDGQRATRRAEEDFSDAEAVQYDLRLGDRVYSRTEAEIRLNRLMEDEGIIDTVDIETGEALIGGEFGDQTQYRYVIDKNLPGGENYQEIVFKADGDVPKIADRMFDRHDMEFHFEGTQNNTQFAHALVRDRIIGVEKLKSLHIDELQSDIHKLGKRYGYLTDNDMKLFLSDKEISPLINKLKSEINSFNNKYDEFIDKVRKRGSFEFDDIFTKDANRLYNNTDNFVIDKFDFLIPDTIRQKVDNAYDITEMYELSIFSPELSKVFDTLVESQLKADKTFNDIILSRQYTNLIDKVADLPYKNNWQEVSLNQLLYKAAREGYDSLSISTSDILVDRYTSRYKDFYEGLYDKRYKNHMKKLAKKYEGEFVQSHYDLSDINPNYTPYRHPIKKEGFFDVNAIIITDEMRDLILKEGLPSFAEGGIVM